MINKIYDHWTDQAQCKGKLKLFYPPDKEHPRTRYRREVQAKLICSSCPVMVQCRDYARSNSEYGVWGGESEEDRFYAGVNLPKYIGAGFSRRMKNKNDILQNAN